MLIKPRTNQKGEGSNYVVGLLIMALGVWVVINSIHMRSAVSQLPRHLRGINEATCSYWSGEYQQKYLSQTQGFASSVDVSIVHETILDHAQALQVRDYSAAAKMESANLDIGTSLYLFLPNLVDECRKLFSPDVLAYKRTVTFLGGRVAVQQVKVLTFEGKKADFTYLLTKAPFGYRIDAIEQGDKPPMEIALEYGQENEPTCISGEVD